MKTVPGPQRGQVLPLFALMSVAVIGIVALAVDFGLLANQHRNLQEFSDAAAVGGAEQLTPAALAAGGAAITAAEKAGRQQAFIVLRDNLFGGAATVPTTSLGSCWRPNGSLFDGDARQCQLPAPYDSYTVTICAPAETNPRAAPCTTPEASPNHPEETISVRITELVGTSFERLLGRPTATAGAFAEARYAAPGGDPSANGAGQRLGFALYSNGCVTTGNQLEIVGGDVYINQCTLIPQSNGQGAFCAESTGSSSGSIYFGPQATGPSSTPVVNQSLASCQAATGGNIVAMGSSVNLATAINLPRYVPPPGYQQFNPDPNAAGSAVASASCKNGSVQANGSPATNCFNPGVYRTLTAISNNLNPGIYYITGDPNCSADSMTTSCTGVVFASDTANLNWHDVRDTCWAAPNNPATATFVQPCPDGVVTSPLTGVSDPQCTYVGAGATAPVPVVTATGPAGSLGGIPANNYFVRVSAFTAFGESAASAAVPVAVLAPLKQGISVTFPSVAGVKYGIYVSPIAEASATVSPRDERQFSVVTAGVGLSTTVIIGSLANVATATAYPAYDTSSCSGEFRNVPSRADSLQNYGVTFVLANKAGLSDSGHVVLISPFCSTERNDLTVDASEIPVAQPAGVPVGTDCEPPYAQSGAYLNDGAFPVYSTSTGDITADTPHGTYLGLTGTLFGPLSSLNATNKAEFAVVPGQAIVRTVNVSSGNHPDPLFYYPCCSSSTSYGGFTGARSAATVQLVR